MSISDIEAFLLEKLWFMSYCEYVATLDDANNVHRHYHDFEYGFPIASDNELFCRLVLEINQAGLSWQTILNKQTAFREAYAQFDIALVAAFNENDFDRLMNDKGIIRNRLKINAAIHNAQQILILQQEYGSFGAWIAAHHPRSLDNWVKLFKQQFKFVGGEIVNEFLMSTGFLPGAHDENCPIYSAVLQQSPAWQQTADNWCT